MFWKPLSQSFSPSRRRSRTARACDHRHVPVAMVVVFIFEGVRIIPQQNAWAVDAWANSTACSSRA